jgi:hypothetical protein
VDSSVACQASVLDRAEPSAYQVVCPAGGPGSQLISTITFGDFDYTFLQPL